MNRLFRRFGMNVYKLFSSALLLAAVSLCAVFRPELAFSLPRRFYAVLTAYFGFFIVCDMLRGAHRSRYKSKQFGRDFEYCEDFDPQTFAQIRKKYDSGALRSMIFWIAFLIIAALPYLLGLVGRIWILFLCAMSNFCVYFAIFFWCPFHKLLLKPRCCMDCRIFNWDSFFSFSFLIYIPSVYSFILLALSTASLIEWEINYHRRPEFFFTYSNAAISCEHCDMEHCKNHKPLGGG